MLNTVKLKRISGVMELIGRASMGESSKILKS